jgi:hypothetical protein
MESDVELTVADFPEANRLTIHILAAVAEHEVRLISERTKSALSAAKARGAALGSNAHKDRQAHVQVLKKARQVRSAKSRDRATATMKAVADARALGNHHPERDRLQAQRMGSACTTWWSGVPLRSDPFSIVLLGKIERLRRSRFGHQEPKDQHADKRCRRNGEKYDRATKAHRDDAEQRGAQRGADAGRCSDQTLG